MKIRERHYGLGRVEVEIVSEHGQPIAMLDVERRRQIGDDDGLDHFAVRYMLRAKNETAVAFVGRDKPDTAHVPRTAP